MPRASPRLQGFKRKKERRSRRRGGGGEFLNRQKFEWVRAERERSLSPFSTYFSPGVLPSFGGRGRLSGTSKQCKGETDKRQFFFPFPFLAQVVSFRGGRGGRRPAVGDTSERLGKNFVLGSYPRIFFSDAFKLSEKTYLSKLVHAFNAFSLGFECGRREGLISKTTPTYVKHEAATNIPFTCMHEYLGESDGGLPLARFKKSTPRPSPPDLFLPPFPLFSTK